MPPGPCGWSAPAGPGSRGVGVDGGQVSPSGVGPRGPQDPLLLPPRSAFPQGPPGAGQSGAAGSSGVPGGVSRQEGSVCRAPGWGPPRLLPGGPCARGAPAKGRGCTRPASQAPLPGSLGGRGPLWPSGYPSGEGELGPWMREKAQASSSCPGGRARGPQPGPASTPLSEPEPQRTARRTLRPSGGAGPPLGLGLPRRPHRKWRR